MPMGRAHCHYTRKVYALPWRMPQTWRRGRYHVVHIDATLLFPVALTTTRDFVIVEHR
jgi:hypothetical protein